MENKTYHQRGLPPSSGDSITDRYTDEESELLRQIVRFRAAHHVSHVTPTQVLFILKGMGYARTTATGDADARAGERGG